METKEPKMLKFKGNEYPCCASLTMGIIGGKWKTVILFHLIEKTLRYNELRKRLVTISQENSKVVFVSGHEHNLQYLIQDNLRQIVSGSGSKVTATRNVGGGQLRLLLAFCP